MKKIISFSFLFLVIQFSAFSQSKSVKNPEQKLKTSIVSTYKITNSTVKAAFEAWQNGDSKTWLSFFTNDADLYDDGNSRDFLNFSMKNIGKEKFLTIDNVENEGRTIYGNFHTTQWGDFKTYFRFNIDKQGKIYRLDIGQAEY